ncbi:hypothetical protein AK830_g6856 [Neonectria ditissima]|uniref:Uncharacterized protein n=1 Tax=Neonectria ditissima TaxID=78410 RepID=A0A0P7AYM9_9HYPO|nr:hypothetical protein AK830_g6856 [Neonectria ditissima]
MLRPEHDETALWAKRPWLIYWYGIIDSLFEVYGIFATSPDADWFTRPTVVTPKQATRKGASAVISRRNQSSSPSASYSDSSLSTVRWIPSSSNAVQPSLADADEKFNLDTFALLSWVFGQNTWRNVVDFEPESFDPTPGGRVSVKRGVANPLLNQTASSHITRLNPEATEFVPKRAHVRRYPSTSVNLTDNTENLFEACSDIASPNSSRSGSLLHASLGTDV